MASSISQSERASHRTVVLLRESDYRKLERLSRKEKVSAGEIIRRSLDTYETTEARIRKEQETEMLKSAISMLHEALSSANESVAATCAKLDKLHLELKKRDAR